MTPVANEFFRNVVVDIPLFLVYGIGFVLGLAYWRRSPGSCLFLVLGMALMAANGLLFAFLYAWVPEQQSRQGWTGEEVVRTFKIMGFVSGLLYAAANGLLIVAALKGRPPAVAGHGFVPYQPAIPGPPPFGSGNRPHGR